MFGKEWDSEADIDWDIKESLDLQAQDPEKSRDPLSTDKACWQPV